MTKEELIVCARKAAAKAYAPYSNFQVGACIKMENGSYYTGYTNDLDKRLKDHNDGNGARYTRVRLPVRLVYYEEYTTKEEAMRREALIKQLTRKEKECLIKKG